MLALLQGEVVLREGDEIVLMVGGVGYEVSVPMRVLSDLVEGEVVTLYIAENIREDAYELFGYTTAEDKRLHKKLVGVQGVGAKLAHAILSHYDAETLRELIEGEDLVRLGMVSGVGKKTAQRILLDLRGKLVTTTTSTSRAEANDPALLALLQLGFLREQAEQALLEVDSELETGERIRQALKGMGR
ncbi:Holliday junction branch migration protein RuvA [bacterium]|nr:Holliday junction branch migration protein RuvA [bacterium]